MPDVGADGYVSDLDALDAVELGTIELAAGDGHVRQPRFAVSNPMGSVTVSAHPDGHIERVDLSGRVAEMTERELAEEIVVIAGLASQDAKSAQYVTMLEGMREQGHDDHATREFLQRDLDLPTPEQAWTRRTEVFSSRYAGTHE
ncbi:YbaB/EbfC family DNA-binding protein [Mycobacterium sp. 852013-51886_SCH5428379]|uniref:YbaB/EbfC family DNA-binding protein n=1 Tax=Mycobacteriaceae TaxID=1762 RepID=UPI000A3FF601|nr:YbaB/EbfC family DNA-binding protein [Mycobacterium sp. 852013-51886_SCH5428379]